MILQDEIMTVIEAAEANPTGAAIYVLLLGFLGMFSIMLVFKRMRNVRILSLLLFFVVAALFASLFMVWPEFQGILFKDPVNALIGLGSTFFAGVIVLPWIIVFIIIIVTGIFAGRGN